MLLSHLFPHFFLFQDLYTRKVRVIDREDDRLYKLRQLLDERKCIPISGLNAVKEKMDIGLWHKRLGHASVGLIK